MSCTYCSRPSRKQDGIDVEVCPECWKLLQNPITALPLIRGHLTMTLRGKMPDSELKMRIDEFMKFISIWQKKV